MTVSHSGATLRRFTVAAALAIVATDNASAQTTTFSTNTTTPTTVSIEDLTARWASLELPLLGVTDLTDLQRDAIELLEEKFRTLFNDEAGPIRAARVTLYQRGPFERHNVERALERMAELRRRELELTRSILTDAQRPRYDQNLKAIAAQEASANTKREREAAFFTP